MDFLLDALTEWLKEMLVGGIMGNLSGMFDSVNQQVGDCLLYTSQSGRIAIPSMIWNLWRLTVFCKLCHSLREMTCWINRPFPNAPTGAEKVNKTADCHNSFYRIVAFFIS